MVFFEKLTILIPRYVPIDNYKLTGIKRVNFTEKRMSSEIHFKQHHIFFPKKFSSFRAFVNLTSSVVELD